MRADLVGGNVVLTLQETEAIMLDSACAKAAGMAARISVNVSEARTVEQGLNEFRGAMAPCLATYRAREAAIALESQILDKEKELAALKSRRGADVYTFQKAE